MSHQVNSELFERAAEMVDYWEGTLHAEYIKRDLEANDLNQLMIDVTMAERACFEAEYNPKEAGMPDEFGDIY